MIRMLLAYWTKEPARRCMKFAEVGKRYFDRRKWNQATNAFAYGWQSAKKIVGRDDLARFFRAFFATHLGFVAGNLRQYDDARMWAERAIEVDPAYAKAHECLARALIGLGDLAEAERELATALRLNSEAKEPDPGIDEGIRVLREQLSSIRVG